MSKKTPLYEQHLALQAKMVDFHGWLMPLHYGSQLDEHESVRQHVGIFDVSHMTTVDIRGQNTLPFLRYLLANDVAKLTTGGALYTPMLNHQGGIIDDLIAYKIADDWFRLIVNSATRDKDLAWLHEIANPFEVKLQVQDNLANIAIQGPKAIELVSVIFKEFEEPLKELKPFRFIKHENLQISTTGYTGEAGVEILLPKEDAPSLWESFLKLGAKPCGLGARDTLRLEAGLNLYGSDMDENVTPLEANIAWTVAFEPTDRDFIGRSPLFKQKNEGGYPILVGLLLEERGIPRTGQPVSQDGREIGVVISGTFSPTMQKGIAFVRITPVEKNFCELHVRGKPLAATLVKLPFVRNGKNIAKPLSIITA